MEKVLIFNADNTRYHIHTYVGKRCLKAITVRDGSDNASLTHRHSSRRRLSGRAEGMRSFINII